MSVWTLNVKDKYLTPVALEDFRKQVRGARNYLDIFRVFLKNKKASDKTIYDILEGQSILSNIHRRDYDDNNYNDDYSYVLDYRDEGYDHDSASQAYLHFNEVGQCKDPRPEIVHVPSSGREIYFPDYTMVHRCKDESGCCWDEKQECGVKSFNIITRPFLVFHIQPDGNVQPEGQTFTTKFFKNHTECECKHLKSLPKCVKQDKCLKPQCQEGEFVMEKGYCPGVTHSQLSYFLTNGKSNNVNRIRESTAIQKHETQRNEDEDTEQHRKHRHHHGKNGSRRGKKHKNKHGVKK
ncbi:hypothetical protein KUTeg_023976 [Tegillarca granosa]|uniref:Platelet-derived growth factor (PDGF) family profile domain-containing protein n=1 Tax=Tegillarca granosa TaxID=220873 RepID=A0ABQ9E1S9_TEGGR|nr:hypothetical protein KUTeg_023976 [Tegillarca granosa]